MPLLYSASPHHRSSAKIPTGDFIKISIAFFEYQTEKPGANMVGNLLDVSTSQPLPLPT
jgi:hypothetical protein